MSWRRNARRGRQDVGIVNYRIHRRAGECAWQVAEFRRSGILPGPHISGNLAGQNTQRSVACGVTQNDFNDIIEAPNAAYLDDGYFAVAQAQTFGVFDIEELKSSNVPRARCLRETPRAV